MVRTVLLGSEALVPFDIGGRWLDCEVGRVAAGPVAVEVTELPAVVDEAFDLLVRQLRFQ